MDLETIPDRVQAYSRKSGISSEILAQIVTEIPPWYQYDPLEALNIRGEYYFYLLDIFLTNFQRSNHQQRVVPFHCQALIVRVLTFSFK